MDWKSICICILIQIVLRVGRGLEECHCRDVMYCYHTHGCSECLHRYYGSVCDIDAGIDCFCLYNSNCRHCSCGKGTGHGSSCGSWYQDTKTTTDYRVYTPYKENDTYRPGETIGITICIVILAISAVLCIRKIYRKCKHDIQLSNVRSNSQQNGSTSSVRYRSRNNFTNMAAISTSDVNTSEGSHPIPEETNTSESQSDLPPSYDSLEFPTLEIPYPVIVEDACTSNSISTDSADCHASQQTNTNVEAEIDSDLPSYDSIRRCYFRM